MKVRAVAFRVMPITFVAVGSAVLFQNCEGLTSAKTQTSSSTQASSSLDVHNSALPSGSQTSQQLTVLPSLNLTGADGVGNILVVPTDAPYPDIYASLNVVNKITGKTPKLENWMVNFGLYSEHQDPAGTTVGQYIGTAMGPGSAKQWTFNTNMLRGAANIKGEFGQPNTVSKASASINYELDYSNADQDCFEFPCFNVGLYIHNQGLFKSNNAIYLDATNLNQAEPNKKMWREGLTMYGAAVNDFADVNLITNAERSLKVSGNRAFGIEIDAASRNNAIYIHDPVNGGWPNAGGLPANATTASAVSDIGIVTTSKIGVLIEGSHGTASLRDLSTSNTGLHLGGRYPAAAVSTADAKTDVALVAATGQRVCFAGFDACVSVRGDGIMTYNIGGQSVFTVDRAGNATFKGAVRAANIP